MPRIRCALAAIVLLAVSCGSSDTDDLLNELGISEQEAACLTRELEARDLDVDKLHDHVLECLVDVLARRDDALLRDPLADAILELVEPRAVRDALGEILSQSRER